MLTLSFSEILNRLRTLRATTLALALAALVLAGAYGTLGFGYLSESARATALEEDIAQLSAVIRRASVQRESPEEQLATEEARLERDLSMLAYPTPNAVLEQVNQVAREQRVQLSAVAIREGAAREEGPFTYRVYAVNLRAAGAATRLQAFVDALAAAAPAGSPRTARVTGLPENPSLLAEFDFLVNPTVTGGTP
jgi:hypothetical protein